MYSTIDILRNLTRFTGLLTKLKEHEAQTTLADLPRAARTLRDLEVMLSESDLTGIDIVDKNMEFIGKMSASVRTRTTDLLHKSLTAGNHSDLSVALQACYSLNTMSKVVQAVVAERKKEIHRVVTRELDPQVILKAISSAEGPGGETEGARTRTIVLGKLELTLQHTSEQLCQVSSLFSVLKRKRDPTTQQLFWSVLQAEGDIAASLKDDLWEKTAAAVKDKIHRLCKRPNIMLLFVSEYARVAHVFHKFIASLKEFFAMVTNTEQGGNTLGQAWVKEVLGDCEQRFVSDSMERLQERANALTTRLMQAIPKDPDHVAEAQIKIDAKAFGKVALQEVTILRSDAMLLPLVLKNIHVAVAGLQVKCKEAVALVKSPTLTQLTSAPSAGQAFHAAVHNVLAVLHYDITTIITSLPQELLEDPKSSLAVEIGQIHRDLHLIEQTCVGIFAPLCNAMITAVQKLIQQMHTEDYAATPMPTSNGKYVAAVEGRVMHVAKRIFSLYEKDAWVTAQLSSAASKLLVYLCRMAVMVRPIHDEGRTRLVAELQHVGNSFSVLHPVEPLGKPYHEWKSLRRVMFLTPAQLEVSPEVTNGVIAPVTVIHLLFQRVPPTLLLSVHTKLKHTMHDYVEWLDELSRQGSLAMVSEAVSKCILEYQGREDDSPEKSALIKCANTMASRLVS
jgi:hypothetical protein